MTSSITLPTEAGEFEAHRPHLLGIAYRMTGSLVDAEDIVQDAWLRWQAAERSGIREPRAFLATIVSRLALDHMKSARVRREQYPGQWLPEPVDAERFAGEGSPEQAIEMQESLSFASLVLLERLTPAERAVFLLRDVFDYDYEEIATMVDRSQAACRQILHRARERLAEGNRRFACTYQQRLELLQAFSRAAGEGDMEALTGLLAEDVVLVSDGGGKRNAALNPIYGREKLLRFVQGGQKAEPPDAMQFVSLNGEPALATYREGELRTLFLAEPDESGRIATLYAVRNPDKLWDAERLGNEHPDEVKGRPPGRALS